MPSSSGMSFTPHVIAVSVGEVCDQILVLFVLLEMVFNLHTLCVCFCQDIASKVLSFSQQGPRATCVLSVSGAVSAATILQPSPSQGAIKYEVFNIIYYHPHVLLCFTRQRNTTHVCWCNTTL